MTLVHVLAEASQVEAIIQALEARFSHHREFRVILMEVMATSPALEVPTEESAQEKPEPEADKPSPEGIACLELTEKLSGAAEISKNYILAVLLSAIVAAVGLVRDNVAIIIGAMVIAPFLTPNMALALATTLGDAKLARRALNANWAGIGIALALAAVLGFAMPIYPEVNEIACRAEVGYSDIILALAAGCAGALAFTSGVSAALVGGDGGGRHPAAPCGRGAAFRGRISAHRRQGSAPDSGQYYLRELCWRWHVSISGNPPPPLLGSDPGQEDDKDRRIHMGRVAGPLDRRDLSEPAIHKILTHTER